jgi:hypothetical protein
MRYTPTAALRIAVALGCVPVSLARGQDAGNVGGDKHHHPKPFVAIAHRDLTFGEVLPGVTTTIRSDDPHRAALFEVQGEAAGCVRIEFLLPPALISPAGSELELAFAYRDGQADFSRGRFRGVRFDPRSPLIASLGPNGKLYVKLGGTVLPTISQPGGVYAATISITVFNLGT